VRLDEDSGPVACTIPCSTEVAPGRHTLFVTAPGYQGAATTANVETNAVATASVQLVPITGTLLVSSEIAGSIVSIDGEARGFTPAALALPLGTHDVTVTHAGFRPFARSVTITADGQERVDADLTLAEEVVAASRLAEAVEDAPSSVTIIPGEELRAMGYPTIAEAVRGVRGLFVSDDTSYTSVGFRGFSLPGDYGNKVLVLVDGHPINDDYIGSSYVGYDARADIDDVQRIEIVRGPGSALYGTGAFTGVINLVTRDRQAPTHGEVAVSTAGDSVGHARATAQVRLSPEAGGWVSVAGAHGSGRDFFFPEYASDPATGGASRGVDGFDAGTVNGRVWWRALSLQWLLTSRKKSLPSGEFETLLGDPRTHFTDTRGYVEARFEPRVSRSVEVLTRAYADMYDFDDFLAYAPADGGPATEAFRGRWVGLEQRFVVAPVPGLRVTAGGEGQRHLQTRQTGNNDQISYIDRSDPFWLLAGYAVADVTPSRIVKISAGSRLDYYSFDSSPGAAAAGAIRPYSALSPRGAVIVHPDERDVLKLLAGRAFRAPSVYEHYYQGPTQVPGGDLDPEQIVSGEIEFTHRFSSTIDATVATYGNYVTNLIALTGDGTTASPNRYVNTTNPVLSTGVELELRREWRAGWMFGASYAFQHSRYLDDTGTAGLRHVPNSPEHLGAVKGAVPIVGGALLATTRLTIEGPRYDRYAQPTDPPQQSTDGAVIWDFVLSGEAPRYGMRYWLGLYNAMNYKYVAPVSPEFAQDTVPQSGRTVLAGVQVTF
jgi:outer membrane receptor protein involved in Fe transport